MKIIRLITLILIAALAVASLSACRADEPELTTEPAHELTDPVEQKKLVLVENGTTDFKIIRAEAATGYYLDTANAVYMRARSALSPDIKLSEDWNNPFAPTPADAHEILLFETNRPESVQALADLDIDGYLIRVTEHKIVIVGSSLAASNAALYRFFDELIPAYTSDGTIALPVGLEIKEEHAAEKIDFGKAMREGKTVCAHYEIVFHRLGTDGFSISQGAATDGTYVYVAMKNGAGAREVDKILKIDMATWEVVAESEVLPLDHANDITYDPAKKQLVVVNMYENLISLIDTETLALVEQKALPYGTWGVGYVDGASEFAFLAYGTPSGLVITDADFNPIRSSPLADAPGYVGQGMDADAQFAYVPLSPETGKNENLIFVYDIKTGELLGTVSVDTKMESESMFHVGDKHYMHFNSRGSQIARLEYYVRFE